MSDDLEGYMVGRTMTFKEPSGDEAFCRTVLVDVTDMKDGQIELGFTIENPRLRVYLRVKQSELNRVLKTQAVIP